jgi:hypothetical protein
MVAVRPARKAWSLRAAQRVVHSGHVVVVDKARMVRVQILFDRLMAGDHQWLAVAQYAQLAPEVLVDRLPRYADRLDQVARLGGREGNSSILR